MSKLTAAHVLRQISNPCRNRATDAQLRYLAALIAEQSNSGLIRWDTKHCRSYTVYDASKQIESMKAKK